MTQLDAVSSNEKIFSSFVIHPMQEVKKLNRKDRTIRQLINFNDFYFSYLTLFSAFSQTVEKETQTEVTKTNVEKFLATFEWTEPHVKELKRILNIYLSNPIIATAIGISTIYAVSYLADLIYGT
jgi:hypothetical protein